MITPTFPDVLVVGMHFRGAEVKNRVANFIPPLALTLEREPANQFDPNAIKVLDGFGHIGYIESTQACWIAPHMDEGAAFTCTVTDLVSRRNNVHPLVTLTPTSDD